VQHFPGTIPPPAVGAVGLRRVQRLAGLSTFLRYGDGHHPSNVGREVVGAGVSDVVEEVVPASGIRGRLIE